MTERPENVHILTRSIGGVGPRSRPLTRAAIVARARALRAEITQIFFDAEHWNRIRPHEPIDPDPDGQLKRIAEGLDKMLSTEKET